MELLRKCPCAVMLVRHGSVVQHPRVAAAVNVSTVDEVEQALNVKIATAALASGRSRRRCRQCYFTRGRLSPNE